MNGPEHWRAAEELRLAYGRAVRAAEEMPGMEEGPLADVAKQDSLKAASRLMLAANFHAHMAQTAAIIELAESLPNAIVSGEWMRAVGSSLPVVNNDEGARA